MKNHNIMFRQINANDLVLLHKWFQIPHILKWYARNKKYTFEMIKEKYFPRINDTSIPNFFIYDQDTPVGYIQYYHVTKHLPEGISDSSHPLFSNTALSHTGASFKPKELAGIDLFIADENYLRTGFGSEALALFINTHLKDKFRAVLVDPSKHNIAAISFFEKNGFKHIISQDNNYDLMILRLE